VVSKYAQNVLGITVLKFQCNFVPWPLFFDELQFAYDFPFAYAALETSGRPVEKQMAGPDPFRLIYGDISHVSGLSWLFSDDATVPTDHAITTTTTNPAYCTDDWK